MEKKIEILGYSERGIFNSIIYYLKYNPDLIGGFLSTLKIDGFSKDSHDFVFLNEQSFSDFGDNDLTIIATNRDTEDKTVIFIEGKVKAYDGSYSLEKEFNKITNEKKDVINKGNDDVKGFSSNVFIQLYYKYLLQKILNDGKEDTKYLEEVNKGFKKKSRKKEQDFEDRKIGKNGIVLKACDLIKGAKDYYYVAILPNNDSNTLSELYEKLNVKLNVKMEQTKNIRDVLWQEIEDFFKEENKDSDVIKNFDFNKDKNKSQIY